MNRNHDREIFQKPRNGVAPPNDEPHPHEPEQSFGRDHDHGFFGADSERGYGRETHVWRGRDEHFDFWGRPRRHDEGLWQRVKGVFKGHGPKNYTRSDERIHEDVCERLTYHPYVDASDIEVTVTGAEVTLEGTVEDRKAKRLAEECLDDVSGVKDIHNRLRVRPPVPHGITRPSITKS